LAKREWRLEAFDRYLEFRAIADAGWPRSGNRLRGRKQERASRCRWAESEVRYEAKNTGKSKKTVKRAVKKVVIAGRTRELRD
jgi:hypothetical protein